MTPVDTIITCPICDREAQELIPDDACVLEYECEGCDEVLRPKDGDCCVFCSYSQGPVSMGEEVTEPGHTHDEHVERGFMLGLFVAQHVFGIERGPLDDTMDNVIDVVEEIARGELTLVKTDAEAERELSVPAELQDNLPKLLRGARRSQREAAEALERVWSTRLENSD